MIELRKKEKVDDAEKTYAEKVDQNEYTKTPYVRLEHRFQVKDDD